MYRPLPLLVTLALALAGGAEASPTLAGTRITNTATMNFLPDGATTAATVTSNTVTTVVLPVPAFSITPNEAPPGGQDNPNAALDRVDVRPGSQQVFAYTVGNDGNTPVVIDLATATRSDNAPTSVRYFLDADADGLLDYTDINGNDRHDSGEPTTDPLLVDGADGGSLPDTGVLAPGAGVRVLQVYVVPSAAAPLSLWGANPVGTAQYDPAWTPGAGGVDATTAVMNAGGTAPQIDQDNFNRVRVYAPAAVIGPFGFPDGLATGTYALNGTTIIRAGSVQTAAVLEPQSVVTFLNTVRNLGTLADRFNLLAPVGVPGVTSVVFRAEGGAELPDTDGDGHPDLPVGANAAANVEVVVTYDPALIASPQIDLPIAIDSVSDAGSAPESATTDRINNPGVSFTGVSGPSGTSPAPLNPRGTVGGLVTWRGAITNTGGLADTLTVNATVPFPNVTGALGGVSPSGVTFFRDLDCDGVRDSAVALGFLGISGGQTVCVIAEALVPGDARPGTTPPFTHAVNSNLYGSAAPDTASTVTVLDSANAYDPVKTVNGGVGSAGRPGDLLVYEVLGKNTNFSVISGLALRDAVPANTEFVSVSAALVAGSRYAYPVAARVLYSLDGAVWTPNVPDAAAVGSGSVYAAIDTDGNGMLTAADVVLPDQGLRLTLTVRIR